MKPKLIVMLTNNDYAVQNAYDIVQEARQGEPALWGFKEEGLSFEEMKRVADLMRQKGKTLVMEALISEEQECLDWAEKFVELGAEYLCATAYHPSLHKYLDKHGVRFLPGVGRVEGRPGKIVGTVESMVAEAREYVERGVFGITLSAYRFVGDPDELIAEIAKIDTNLLFAGSISSYERIDKVIATNAWGFTVGGAFFSEKFGQGFHEQVAAVQAYLDKL